MPTPQQVIDQIYKAEATKMGYWWISAAAAALKYGHYRIFTGRRDSDAYVARYWLTPPIKDDDGFSSANSVVLHQFLRGDDDGALHDHPADFDSTIVCGGYDELLPPRVEGGTPLFGPYLTDCTVRKAIAGDRIYKKAAELHTVINVQPGTFTLVRTGAKIREWGFHAPGELWMGHKQFLDMRAGQSRDKEFVQRQSAGEHA
jgi:hypothetical protein